MAAAIRDLPKYQTLMAKYSKHLALHKECMDKAMKRKLIDIAALEQLLVTG